MILAFVEGPIVPKCWRISNPAVTVSCAHRMPAITMQTVVSRRREAHSAEIGAEIILMSVQNGKYYGMGETGSDIWRRIEQPVRVDRLCSALSVAYAGDPATIARDVIEFLDRCAADDLLEDLVTVPFGDGHCT
jgi:hypothetical protein